MSKLDAWLSRTTWLLCIFLLLIHLANGAYDLALNYSLTDCSFG